jgi:N-acetylglucosamine-6-sulfatase
MKSKRLIILSLVLFFYTISNAQKNQTSKTKKPNFLFVLVDDQPFDAVGYSGRYPFLKTPNIDWLNEEGANLENFFVTQSICSPSRASFLTGTYPHIHGVNQNNRHVDPKWDEFEPYTSHLQNAGYETAHVGKIQMAHLKGEDHIRPGQGLIIGLVLLGKENILIHRSMKMEKSIKNKGILLIS